MKVCSLSTYLCTAPFLIFALQYHPDKNSSPDAEEKFKEIRYNVSSCYLYPIAHVLP